MKFFNKIFVAVVIFLTAATLTTSLLAQGYYGVVTKEGSEYVLTIKNHTSKPSTNSTNLWVTSELSATNFTASMLNGCSYKASINRVKLDVSQTFKPKSTAYWFDGLSKLTQIENLENLNTTEVSSMKGMFRECSSLKSLDISAFITNKVTDMSAMFYLCTKLSALHFGPKFTDFTTTRSGVTDMSYMFYGCSSLEALNIELFDMRKATNINSMFYACSKLKYIFFNALNEDNMSLASVQQSTNCFYGCTNLVGVSSRSATVSYSASKVKQEAFCSADKGGYLTPTQNGGEGKYFTSLSKVNKDFITIEYGADLDLSDVYIVQEISFAYDNAQKYSMKLMCLDDLKYKLKNFNNTTSGTQKPSIVYNGKTFQFEVYVKLQNLGYKVLTAPTKKTYTMPVSEKELDVTTGLQIAQVKAGGAALPVQISSVSYTIKGFNPNQVGSQTITIVFTIDGTTFDYQHTITLNDVFKEFKVIAEPNVRNYTMPFKTQDLDLSGGVIQKVYASGVTNVAMSDLTKNVSIKTTQVGEQEVSIKFTIDGKTFDYKYKINLADALNYVTIMTYPTKEDYTLPFSALDISDGVIRKTNYSGSYTDIPMSDCDYEIEGLLEGQTGQQDIKLIFTIEGKTVECPLRISVKDAIKDFKVSSAPSKTEYTMPFTALDLSGGVIQKIYHSGKTTDVDMRGLTPTVSGLNTSSAGEQDITLGFTIEGKKFEYKYKITVKDVLRELKVFSIPTIKDYTLPFSTLDLTDGLIQKVYASGKIENVSMSSLSPSISGLNTKEAGEQEITLNFEVEGKSLVYKYKINVTDVLTELKATFTPSKTEYTMPFSALDLSGGVIQKVYSSGKTTDVNMNTLSPVIKGLNVANVGEQEITLNFTIDGKSLECKYKITVNDAIKEYKVTSAPSKTEYTMPFSALDLTGGVIQREMWSGATTNLNMSDLSPVVSGLNVSSAGEQEITLNFTIDGKSLECKYKITVNDAIKEYRVVSAPNKTEYTMPFTALDLNGGVIQREMWSGATTNLNMSDLVYNILSGLNPNLAGEQILELGFEVDGNTFNWSYKITLKEKESEGGSDKEEGGDQPGGGDEPGDGDDKPGTGDGGDEPGEGGEEEGGEDNPGSGDKEPEGGDEPGTGGEEGDGDNPGAGEGDKEPETGEEEGGDEPGEGGDKPGTGEEEGGGDEPGEGGEDPIVAAEDLNSGAAAFEAWTSGGVLSVRAARGGVLEVLSVNGVVVRREEAQSGSSLNLVLKTGVYVLRLGNEVKKVVVE